MLKSFYAIVLLSLYSLSFAASGTGGIDEAAVEAYYAAWSNHDIKTVVGYFTEDCIYEDVATGDLAQGHDELRAFAKKFLDDTPGVKVVPQSITIGKKRAAVEWLMSGGSGADAWSVRGVAILEIKDGLFSRATDYWNVDY